MRVCALLCSTCMPLISAQIIIYSYLARKLASFYHCLDLTRLFWTISRCQVFKAINVRDHVVYKNCLLVPVSKKMHPLPHNQSISAVHSVLNLLWHRKGLITEKQNTTSRCCPHSIIKVSSNHKMSHHQGYLKGMFKSLMRAAMLNDEEILYGNLGDNH